MMQIHGCNRCIHRRPQTQLFCIDLSVDSPHPFRLRLYQKLQIFFRQLVAYEMNEPNHSLFDVSPSNVMYGRIKDGNKKALANLFHGNDSTSTEAPLDDGMHIWLVDFTLFRPNHRPNHRSKIRSEGGMVNVEMRKGQHICGNYLEKIFFHKEVTLFFSLSLNQSTRVVVYTFVDYYRSSRSVFYTKKQYRTGTT